MEAARDEEVSELNAKWAKAISNYLDLKVNSVRKKCLHTHVLQSTDTQYAEYFGDHKNSVFVGFYCVACGQFSTIQPISSTTITLATPEDIHRLYGLK